MEAACAGKPKVVFVMGATGAGKSRLSIDLALHFNGEIVNSDCMQFYEGLDILTNKVSCDEIRRVPHHLLGTVYSKDKFTPRDFRDVAVLLIESIVARKKLPIVVGGSNSYMQALLSSFVMVNDNEENMSPKKSSSYEKANCLRYDCCILWVDASLPVIEKYVDKRVDIMVRNGLLKELQEYYHRPSDDAPALSVAVGVPEFAEFFKAFYSMLDFNNNNNTAVGPKERILQQPETLIETTKTFKVAVSKMKANTCILVRKQRRRIHEIKTYIGWQIHELDTTHVLESTEAKQADENWRNLILEPSLDIVSSFLLCADSVADDKSSPRDSQVCFVDDKLFCRVCGNRTLRDIRDRKCHNKSLSHRREKARLKRKFNATENLSR